MPRLRDGPVYRPHGREATTTSRWARRLGSWWTHPDPMPAVCRGDCLTRSPDRPPRTAWNGSRRRGGRHQACELSAPALLSDGDHRRLDHAIRARDTAPSRTIRAPASVSGQSGALRSEPRLTTGAARRGWRVEIHPKIPLADDDPTTTQQSRPTPTQNRQAICACVPLVSTSGRIRSLNQPNRGTPVSLLLLRRQCDHVVPCELLGPFGAEQRPCRRRRRCRGLLLPDRRSHATGGGRGGWFHRAPVATAGIVTGVGDRRRCSRSYKSAATTDRPNAAAAVDDRISQPNGERRSRAAGSRGRGSRARRRRPTHRDSRQSCASRATRGCRRKQRAVAAGGVLMDAGPGT